MNSGTFLSLRHSTPSAWVLGKGHHIQLLWEWWGSEHRSSSCAASILPAESSPSSVSVSQLPAHALSAAVCSGGTQLTENRVCLVTSVVLETWEDRFLHHHPLPTLGLWSRHTKMVASPSNGTCFLKKRTKHRLPSLFILPHMTRCVPESRQEWMAEDRCVGS